MRISDWSSDVCSSDLIAWREHGGFAHWHLGQVVERLTDLPSSLRQASAVQPQFEMAQRNAVDRSISVTDVPASRRQAEAISALIQNSEGLRSEECREGKECVRTFRYRWAPYD